MNIKCAENPSAYSLNSFILTSYRERGITWSEEALKLTMYINSCRIKWNMSKFGKILSHFSVLLVVFKNFDSDVYSPLFTSRPDCLLIRFKSVAVFSNLF